MTRNEYFARRAALTGEPMPALFHVSFNIGGRVVSDRVRGYMAAVARLDLLIEEVEAAEQTAKRRIVLATNCKVRIVEEMDPYVRATLAVMRDDTRESMSKDYPGMVAGHHRVTVYQPSLETLRQVILGLRAKGSAC